MTIRKIPRRLILLAFLAANVSVSQAAVSTGFESPFTPGAIGGQQGWTANANVSASITTANPHQGTQDVRIVDSNSSSTGFIESPATGFDAGAHVDSDVWLSINRSDNNPKTGGTYLFTIVNSSLGILAEFRLDPSGTIFYADSSAPNNVGNFGTMEWIHNQYMHYTIDYDPSDNVIQYTVDGTTKTATGAGSSSAQVNGAVFLTDNNQNIGESADWDDFSISSVPEPLLWHWSGSASYS